ncbi:MAG: hypothetical protein J6R73_00130 [Alistipes sp.]|nr:hypothetical protein [Alistipes sp.]
MRIATLITATLLLLGSCSKEDEDVLLKQKERMISYLESTHNPRLVAEVEVEEGVEQPFYTVVGDGAYRYIDGYYNPDRPNRKEVTAQSKVTITFSAYLFNFTNITTDGSRITLPYYSNNPLYEELFYRPVEEGGAGLTPGAWSFEPLVIDLKSASIIEGLRLALIGCRERDRVEAYMTFNMAYGDHYLNIIGREQPIAYFFTVDTVE